MAEAKGLNSLERSEHISPEDTGDNISAKRVAPYGYDETNKAWSRLPTPFIDKANDYVEFTNADTNGNYQTITFKSGGSGGTPVRTLSLLYDANSNVTSIARS